MREVRSFAKAKLFTISCYKGFIFSINIRFSFFLPSLRILRNRSISYLVPGDLWTAVVREWLCDAKVFDKIHDRRPVFTSFTYVSVVSKCYINVNYWRKYKKRVTNRTKSFHLLGWNSDVPEK